MSNRAFHGASQLSVTHTVRLPDDAEESSSYGLGEDGKFAIDQVEVTNHGEETVSFKHWEVWSAEYLATSSPTQWVRVQEGPLMPITEMNDIARMEYSSNFDIEQGPVQGARGSSSYAVKRHYPVQPPPFGPQEISYDNFYPPSAVLSHHPSGGNRTKAAVEFVTDCGSRECPGDVAKLLETVYGGQRKPSPPISGFLTTLLLTSAIPIFAVLTEPQEVPICPRHR